MVKTQLIKKKENVIEWQKRVYHFKKQIECRRDVAGECCQEGREKIGKRVKGERKRTREFGCYCEKKGQKEIRERKTKYNKTQINQKSNLQKQSKEK